MPLPTLAGAFYVAFCAGDLLEGNSPCDVHAVTRASDLIISRRVLLLKAGKRACLPCAKGGGSVADRTGGIVVATDVPNGPMRQCASLTWDLFQNIKKPHRVMGLFSYRAYSASAATP